MRRVVSAGCVWAVTFGVLCNLQLQAQNTVVGPIPPKVKFVQVESGVKLEVLDWGGTGRAVILLAGLGNDAHVFDNFGPKLAARYHVYGITRRGYGASDSPAVDEENYSADRLGDDVIAVINTLKLDHPVLVGHSIAGEELSSVGSRHPECVAGLIYLEAGYEYALYDPSHGDFELNTNELRRHVAALNHPLSAADQSHTIDEILKDWPSYEKVLLARKKELSRMSPLTPEQKANAAVQMKTRNVISGRAIIHGEQRYTEIKCPLLAIFADPHDFGSGLKGEELAEAEAHDRSESQAKLFEALPGARVVRMPHAGHYIFLSNEADVLRAMNTFIASLP